MLWQIDVRAKDAGDDARGRGVLAALHRAGFGEVTSVRSTRLYQIEGNLRPAEVHALARGLFADEVLEKWGCVEGPDWPQSSDVLVEVHLLPGVMDPVALSSVAAARNLLNALPAGRGAATVTRVRTAWRYKLAGPSRLDRVDALARQVLANPCIERVFVCGLGRRERLPQRFADPPPMPFERRTVTLGGLSDDALARLSQKARLFLSAEEMRAIAKHFAARGRDPTDLELETIAQTWSEHCIHKTLTSAVEYRGRGFGLRGTEDELVTATYENLLQDTVMRATKELNKPWCLSVFADNAGVIEFDDQHAVAFKVETHNHPSAIEPYGGAATGVGGCVRDILGCGRGARPIASTDVFCLAYPDYAVERLPRGVMAPRRVLRGVVAGVGDYGNRMGIPTVAGGLHFDDRYLANPLVFCGCVGIIPSPLISKAPREGDLIVLVGGRTGRDGLGGATFSSAALTERHADEFAHAVQIGNAIEEKKLLDALLRARDDSAGCLYSSITDCGAGGLSSAVGEMGATLGAVVELDRVPLKYSGLRYNEIWLSEAQERMVLSVPAENLAALREILAQEDVESAVIGRFTGDGVLSLRCRGVDVGNLDVAFLHHGLPRQKRSARWEGPESMERVSVDDTLNDGKSLCGALLESLGARNVCSREALFRQYDHEVQGTSVVKALVGVGEGPSDGTVIRPLLTSHRGVALGCGLCPGMSDEDPYWMAVSAIDEAVRNVVAVGADPERIALLDNFCWGGCDDAEQMGALVRACQGCYDAAMAYQTPFISGKDSLNNEFSLPAAEARRLGLARRMAIPPTLLISAVGIVPDVRRCVTSDLKGDGHRLLYVAADIRADGPARCAAMHRAVAEQIRRGAVAACHDVSDGGLAVCVAEMCIGGRRGASLALEADRSDLAALLFDESRSAYVLELADSADWSALGKSSDVRPLGSVTGDARLRIVNRGETVVDITVDAMESAWRRSLRLGEEV